MSQRFSRLMKTVIFAAITVSAVSATANMVYKSFLAEHGKDMSRLQDPSRVSLFEAVLKAVSDHNTAAGATFKLALNKYADMTPEELSSQTPVGAHAVYVDDNSYGYGYDDYNTYYGGRQNSNYYYGNIFFVYISLSIVNSLISKGYPVLYYLIHTSFSRR